MANKTVFTPEQKDIADKVIKVFCLNVALIFLGSMTILTFLPLVTSNLGISDTVTGALLAIQPVTCIVTLPLIKWLVTKLGVEAIICGSGVIYSFTLVMLGILCETDNPTLFLNVAFPCTLLNGFGQACNMVGEQTLLLNYSMKEDREKNLGYFRAAIGVGGSFAPYISAGLYAWGECVTVFVVCGVGTFVILPTVYWYLFKAKESFQAIERERQNEAETEDTEQLLFRTEDPTEENAAQDVRKKVTLKGLMSDGTFVWATVALIWGQFCMYYQLPLMNKMFVEVYDIEPSKSNTIYVLSGVGFIICAPLAHILISRRYMTRRRVI